MQHLADSMTGQELQYWQERGQIVLHGQIQYHLCRAALAVALLSLSEALKRHLLGACHTALLVDRTPLTPPKGHRQRLPTALSFHSATATFQSVALLNVVLRHTQRLLHCYAAPAGACSFSMRLLICSARQHTHSAYYALQCPAASQTHLKLYQLTDWRAGCSRVAASRTMCRRLYWDLPTGRSLPNRLACLACVLWHRRAAPPYQYCSYSQEWRAVIHPPQAWQLLKTLYGCAQACRFLLRRHA